MRYSELGLGPRGGRFVGLHETNLPCALTFLWLQTIRCHRTALLDSGIRHAGSRSSRASRLFTLFFSSILRCRHGSDGCVRCDAAHAHSTPHRPRHAARPPTPHTPEQPNLEPVYSHDLTSRRSGVCGRISAISPLALSPIAYSMSRACTYCACICHKIRAPHGLEHRAPHQGFVIPFLGSRRARPGSGGASALGPGDGPHWQLRHCTLSSTAHAREAPTGDAEDQLGGQRARAQAAVNICT